MIEIDQELETFFVFCLFKVVIRLCDAFRYHQYRGLLTP